MSLRHPVRDVFGKVIVLGGGAMCIVCRRYFRLYMAEEDSIVGVVWT